MAVVTVNAAEYLLVEMLGCGRRQVECLALEAAVASSGGAQPVVLVVQLVVVELGVGLEPVVDEFGADLTRFDHFGHDSDHFAAISAYFLSFGAVVAGVRQVVADVLAFVQNFGHSVELVVPGVGLVGEQPAPVPAVA